MTRLSKIWHFLETRNNKTAVLPEWKQRLGDEFRIVEPLLVPLDDLAESYPNSDPYGLPLKVVVHSQDNIVAVCEERTSIRLRLTQDDIILHKLNIAKFSKNIAHSLNLRPNDTLFDGTSFCIGYMGQSGEKEYPVYMLLTGNTDLFLNELQRLLLVEHSPGILLTSTKRCWSSTVMRLMESSKWLAVSLNEMLESSGKSLHPTSIWQTYVNTFIQLIMPPMELKPQFEFKLSGDMWQITYEGVTKHMENSKGCEYIHLLIQNTRKPLFISEIVSHVAGDVKLKGTGNAGEILSDRTIGEYRNRYQDLQQQIAKDQKAGIDTGKLKAEMDILASEVKNALGLGGRKRKGSDDTGKMRIAVFQSINRTISKITKFNKELGMHLENSISTGIFVTYCPDRKIDWELF